LCRKGMGKIMNGRTLYKSKSNKIIAGVCGGIGEYTGIDPNIVRILAVIIPGIGWLAYFIAAVILPSES